MSTTSPNTYNVIYPLSRRQEARLSERARKGDPKALRELVDSHMRAARTLCNRYRHLGVPLHDLIGEAYRGLVEAAQKYDSRHGKRFWKYAENHVKQAVVRSIPRQREGPIRMPDGGDEIPIEVLSLDCPAGDSSEELLLHDVVADPDAVSPLEATIEAESHTALEHAICHLTLKEQAIVRFHFGLTRQGKEYTIGEIGERLSMSRESVRKTIRNSLEKLRHTLRNHNGNGNGHMREYARAGGNGKR
jgi:RNA polymerase sigma factor (sigma-70 family)